MPRDAPAVNKAYRPLKGAGGSTAPIEGGGRTASIEGGGRAASIEGGGRAASIEGGGRAASIEGADAPYEDWLRQCFYPLPVPHKKTNLP